MKAATHLAQAAGRAHRRLRAARRRDERGDIPGWVMVTVMTITLAVGLFGLFGPAITEYLQNALNEFS